MLEDIKTLLGIEITNISKDAILNLYIRKSATLIKNYLNNPTFDDTYIQTNFNDAIIDIVVNAYSIKGKENIKTITQGARSVAYSDNTAFCITESVANLLPMPYLKML